MELSLENLFDDTKSGKGKSSVKWSSKDGWKDKDLGKAADTFWSSQKSKYIGLPISGTGTMANDLDLAFRRCASFTNPEDRSRSFDEFFSVYRNWTPEILSQTKLIQSSFELGVGAFWSKILFEICRKYGFEATAPYKIALLQHRNSLGQNIFHSLATLLNTSSLETRSEAIQLFWTLQVDPLWFGSNATRPAATYVSTSQTTKISLRNAKIRSALESALSETDINGRTPAGIIENFLTFIWKPITATPIPGLSPTSSRDWQDLEQESATTELMSQLKGVLSR